MDWQKGMNAAVDYIENNLTGIIDLKTDAKHVGCSSWEFQRIFSFLAHISLSDYTLKKASGPSA